MSSSVLSTVLDTAGTKKIGVATLNRPEALNGLTLDMCHELTRLLTQWEMDPSIAFVILRGAGERAFCAGGDLHGLYNAMLENAGGQAWENTYAREFFDVEYRLDSQIHTYSKPILCWGNGVVMGGGVGLMMGASHRVVSDTTRFAMPEITIGLFPDVGGTWMLSRLPNGIGVFLALTGAQLGARDCELLGLADYTIPSDAFETLLSDLQGSDWHACRDANDSALRTALLNRRATPVEEPGPLLRHYDLIRNSCGGTDFDAICTTIQGWAHHPDPWLQRAARTFTSGAPSSARLSFTLLHRVRLWSLADVFREEYIVSLHCGIQGDFQEGIRALLIDKDKKPAWNPASLDKATATWVQRYFQAPWPEHQAHPLADLGISH